MTNAEAYPHDAHNHYIYERVCPKCRHWFCSWLCPREPSDLSECLVTDVKDYKKWLLEECEV